MPLPFPPRLEGAAAPRTEPELEGSLECRTDQKQQLYDDGEGEQCPRVAGKRKVKFRMPPFCLVCDSVLSPLDTNRVQCFPQRNLYRRMTAHFLRPKDEFIFWSPGNGRSRFTRKGTLFASTMNLDFAD